MAVTTVRYSDEELRQFKELIDEKLVKALQEIAFTREQMTEMNENSNNQQSGDWTDESTNHTEMEMLNNLLARQQQFIRNLENALLRIQNKTYGICTITGQLIDKNRLRLVPHATKSVEAKNSRPVPNASNHAVNKHRDDEAGTNEQDDASTQKEFFENE